MLADISGKLTSPKLEALKLLAAFKSSQTNHSLPTITGQRMGKGQNPCFYWVFCEKTFSRKSRKTLKKLT
jgi:hypothetical protein